MTMLHYSNTRLILGITGILFFVSLCIADDTISAPVKTFGYGTLSCFALSTNGTNLVTGSDDCRVRLWDVSTGAVLKTFSPDTSRILKVGISADGQHVFSISGKRVYLRNVSDGSLVKIFEPLSIHEPAINATFSPDSKTILISYEVSITGYAKLYSVATGERLKEFFDFAAAHSLAFTPDGKKVLMGFTNASDGSIKMYDIDSNVTKSFEYNKPFRDNSMICLPDSKSFVLHFDYSIWHCDIDSGDTMKVFDTYPYLLYTIGFTPDGKSILAAASKTYENTDTLPLQWDLATGAIIGSVGTEKAAWIAFSSDGSKVITNIKNELKCIDFTSSSLLRTYEGHMNAVNSVAFTPDAKNVLICSDDPAVKLIDITSGNYTRAFYGHRGPVKAGAVSPDGKTILTGSTDSTARLWDIASGALLKTFTGHIKQVSAVAFSPDGKTLLTGSWDYSTKLWDAASGSLLKTFTGSLFEISSVAFSADGKEALTGSWDFSAKRWDINTGILIKTYDNFTDAIYSAVFSPDGKSVLFGCGNGDAFLLDKTSGAEIRKFSGHGGGVVKAAFSPDGKYILTGSKDRTARLWEINTGSVIKTFLGHNLAVNTVDISPDCKSVITGSADKTVNLWSTVNLAISDPLIHAKKAHALFIKRILGDRLIATVPAGYSRPGKFILRLYQPSGKMFMRLTNTIPAVETELEFRLPRQLTRGAFIYQITGPGIAGKGMFTSVR